MITAPDTGNISEQRFNLPATAGREAGTNAVVLADRSVSRRHARFEYADGRVVLTDLGSANGTYVNGQLIQRQPLSPGDLLRIGPYEMAWDLLSARDVDDNRTRVVMPSDLTVVGTKRSTPKVPARQVVEAAEAHNKNVGHELDGFLSITRGFLPRQAPLLSFPGSHQPWDDLVEKLPELFRTLHLRRELDRLPVLDASAEALPDPYLLRASTLLGVVAHAYQYMAIDPPPALPEAILRPWRAVSRRLGKDVPAVSYIDLFFYNWKLRDPTGPRRLDNMDLLIPTWDNEAERIFYLVTTEFAMGLTPVLGAMLSAQEAVVADDRGALEAALLVILDRLQYVTQEIYPQIDPNPRGRNHLDQVLWAKTVGTAGVPIFEGAPSPSGTAQPTIHAMDAFLERQSFGSVVGQQSIYLGGHFPRHWKELVAALREVSVREYVEKTGHSGLRGLYNSMLDAYVGDRGWMGLHRIKAYGFLEVAFKVGRQVTTGARFTGLFKDKTWDKVDAELAVVREERRPAVGPPVAFARPRPGSVVTDPETGAWTAHLELDVAGQGVHHLPGDRVGILAENDDELVRRTLRALQATGDELVGLTPQWRRAVGLRAGFSVDTEVLPLRTVLTFARIRPVGRDTAKRLLDRSAAGALGRIVNARMEDQWELWDVLNLMHAAGYDVTRFWKADPKDPDALCAVVEPEDFRLYSIASATADGAAARTLRLVVGGLSYTSARSPYSYSRERNGSASHFLRRMATEPRHRTKQLSLRIVPTPRFRLPADRSIPVVMFAAGSGVAPFHGFVASRLDTPGRRPDRLYLGLRRPEEFVGRDGMERAAAAGTLELYPAFSQADATTRFDADSGAFVVEPGRRCRVDDLLRTDEHGHALWDLLRPVSEGGRGGHVYLCGSTRFAVSVLDALTAVVRRATGSDAEAREFVRRLVADGRLSLDIFTTYGGHAQQGTVHEVSDLALRNTDEAGLWMAVSGKVYDVGEFIHQHIGGPHIVRNHCGLDATAAYRQVLHHVQSEVDSQLGMYEIGRLRRLRFGGRWGVVLTPEGLRSMPLEELFASWVRCVYLIVGMENALHADYGFVSSTATRGEDPRELTPFKAQYVLETHRRFLVSYLDGLIDEDLRRLWQLAVGFCAPQQDVRGFADDAAALTTRTDYRLVRNSVAHIKGLLTADPTRVQSLCRIYARADLHVLGQLKAALLTGIRAFEQHEADVVEQAGPALVEAMAATLPEIGNYYRRLAADTHNHGITPDLLPAEVVEEPIPEDVGIPGHGGPPL